MFRLTLRALPLALFVALLGACDDDTPTTPVAPTPDPIIETFSGNLNPNGGATHTFTSTTTGSMSATLTTLGPDSAVLGFAIGTWNGTYCSHISAKDDAIQTSVLYGTVTLTAAPLCVRVYDVGRFTGTVSYTITVSHP